MTLPVIIACLQLRMTLTIPQISLTIVAVNHLIGSLTALLNDKLPSVDFTQDSR